MTKTDLHTFLNVVFPQVADQFRVDRVAVNEIDVTLLVNDSHLRPGGTVSGPSMFALADVAIYLAIMAMIGPKALLRKEWATWHQWLQKKVLEKLKI